MNRAVIFSIGILMAVLGALFLVPMAVDLVDGNPDWRGFGVSSVAALFAGSMMMLSSHGHSFALGRREGHVLTVGSWAALSLMAGLPFWMADPDIPFVDAVFEAVSGLTTTGSTVLAGLDFMPRGILLWRGMLQWIGGIGIVVMAVTMLPFLRVGGMHLYRLEASDRYDKIMPRVAVFCARLVAIYAGLTLACALTYWLLGMTVFEAIIHAMTTVSTGGFSTSDESLGHFRSPAIEWAATLFMLTGALPFSVYIRYLRRFDPAVFTGDTQVPGFLFYVSAIVVGCAIFLMLSQPVLPLDALRMAAFNVVSIITTTGYASGDYLDWGVGAATMFFFLTLLGGCAGSTAGGLKVFRLLVMIRDSVREERLLVYRHGTFAVRLAGRQIDTEALMSVYLFFFIMMASLVGLTLALSLTGLDFVTSISAAATAIANVGPGLGTIIGPSGNFAPLPDTAKWALSAGMLAGRLEFLTVLVLFMPRFWLDR